MPKLKVTRTGPLEITPGAVSTATIAQRASPSKAKASLAELPGTPGASAQAPTLAVPPQTPGPDASNPADLPRITDSDTPATANLPGTPSSDTPTEPAAPSTVTPPAKAPTKVQALVTLLRRPEGARLGELMAATGWQAHSVRGAMSGAIKKGLGLTITSEKVDGERLYRIPEAQA
jgi:hypothetical protein